MTRCNLKLVGPQSGRFLFRCDDCQREVVGKYEQQPPKVACKNPGQEPLVLVPPPAQGVGTELAALFREYGIKKRGGCGCENWVAKMNAWGPKGCEEHRAEILEHLKKAYDLSSFWEKAKAVAVAWLKGLPMSLQGIVDESILRYKQQCEEAIAAADEYARGNP